MPPMPTLIRPDAWSRPVAVGRSGSGHLRHLFHPDRRDDSQDALCGSGTTLWPESAEDCADAEHGWYPRCGEWCSRCAGAVSNMVEYATGPLEPWVQQAAEITGALDRRRRRVVRAV